MKCWDDNANVGWPFHEEHNGKCTRCGSYLEAWRREEDARQMEEAARACFSAGDYAGAAELRRDAARLRDE